MENTNTQPPKKRGIFSRLFGRKPKCDHQWQVMDHSPNDPDADLRCRKCGKRSPRH